MYSVVAAPLVGNLPRAQRLDCIAVVRPAALVSSR